MKRILLIGPQGAGKSTQGKMLSQHLNVPYISTGDIVRKIAEELSEEGLRIKEIMLSGNLVDDITVSKLAQKRLSDDDCREGFVLDGYPRTMEQIEYFDPHFDAVFYLKIEDGKAIERLLSRGREDDTPELIDQRLKLYHEQTNVLLSFYVGKGILHTIDATVDIKQVQEKLKEIVNG